MAFVIAYNKEENVASILQKNSSVQLEGLKNQFVSNFVRAINDKNVIELRNCFLNYPETKKSDSFVKAFSSGRVIAVWCDENNPVKRTIVVVVAMTYNKEACVGKRNRGEAIFVFKETNGETVLDWFHSGVALSLKTIYDTSS
jgi:hypothetical protein